MHFIYLFYRLLRRSYLIFVVNSFYFLRAERPKGSKLINNIYPLYVPVDNVLDKFKSPSLTFYGQLCPPGNVPTVDGNLLRDDPMRRSIRSFHPALTSSHRSLILYKRLQ